MDSYIIRIYRRNRDDPEKLLGVIKEVESSTQQSFASLEELFGILKASEAAWYKQDSDRDGHC